MRDHAPVYWDAENELWGIARYDDIVEIEKAKDVFINSDRKKGGYRPNLPSDPSIIGLDDPLHTKRRKLVNRGFTPRTVLAWEDHIQADDHRAARRRRHQGPRRADRRPRRAAARADDRPAARLPARDVAEAHGVVGAHHRRWRRSALRRRRRDHGRVRVRRCVRGALRGEAALPGRRHHDRLDDGGDRRRGDRSRSRHQRLPAAARRRRRDHAHGDRAHDPRARGATRPVPAAARRRRHDRGGRGVHPLGHAGAQHVPGGERATTRSAARPSGRASRSC